jgi:hypothetical protein
VICLSFIFVISCVVLVLDNVFYITPHNCKVHLILVVGDGSKILDFLFLFFFLSFIDVAGKQA